MNRLQSYVTRTVLTAAKNYVPHGKAFRGEARKLALEGAFADAMHGTDSGWWNDLIYTVDVVRLASYYRRDIAKAVRDYLSEVGGAASDFIGRDREFTFADVLVASSRPISMDDYDGSNGAADEFEARALCLGLRFAVEWYAGEAARQYAPDL